MSRFGEWSIDWEVYDWLLDHLPFGSTILELGSGWASGEMSKRWKVHSIEHVASFLGKYNTNYIHVPTEENGWYDRAILKDQMPKTYDLILIDGPDANGRVKIDASLFNWNVPVIIDDMQEVWLKDHAVKLVEDFIKRPYEIKDGGTQKKFMVVPC